MGYPLRSSRVTVSGICRRRRLLGVTTPGTWQAFIEVWFGDEDASRRYLEALRWPDGFVCPLRARGCMADRRGAVDVPVLWPADLGHGRDDLPSDTHAAQDLVRGDLVRVRGQERDLREGSATDSGVRFLRDGLGVDAQAPPGHGSASTGTCWAASVPSTSSMRPSWLPQPLGRRGRFDIKSEVVIAVERITPKGWVGSGLRRIEARNRKDEIFDFVTDTVAPGSVLYTDRRRPPTWASTATPGSSMNPSRSCTPRAPPIGCSQPCTASRRSSSGIAADRALRPVGHPARLLPRRVHVPVQPAQQPTAASRSNASSTSGEHRPPTTSTTSSPPSVPT